MSPLMAPSCHSMIARSKTPVSLCTDAIPASHQPPIFTHLGQPQRASSGLTIESHKAMPDLQQCWKTTLHAISGHGQERARETERLQPLPPHCKLITMAMLYNRGHAVSAPKTCCEPLAQHTKALTACGRQGSSRLSPHYAEHHWDDVLQAPDPQDLHQL